MTLTICHQACRAADVPRSHSTHDTAHNQQNVSHHVPPYTTAINLNTSYKCTSDREAGDLETDLNDNVLSFLCTEGRALNTCETIKP